MSVDATSWAWQQDCDNPSQKLVLMALADMAKGAGDEEPGLCWPSIRLIADKCRMGERTVKRHIADLADAGLIVKRERRRRSDGTLSTWEYIVPFRGVTGDTLDDHQGPSSVDQGPLSAHPGATDGTNQGPPVAPQNHQENPNLEPARALCDSFADLIEASGARRPTVTQRWVTDMDRLIRIDGHEPDQVMRVLRWLYTSSDEVAQFWAPNVRSPAKLRERWDQIAAQVKRRRQQQTPGGTSTVDRVRQANERLSG